MLFLFCIFVTLFFIFFFFSSRRRHTRSLRDWSSDVCSSDLKQGKLSRSRGMARQRFPQTFSPKRIAKLIRQGILQNARFAAAVLVTGVKHGKKEDQHLLIRSDCMFPTLYQIRQQGRFTTPIAYATAHIDRKSVV